MATCSTGSSRPTWARISAACSRKAFASEASCTAGLTAPSALTNRHFAGIATLYPRLADCTSWKYAGDAATVLDGFGDCVAARVEVVKLARLPIVAT